MRISYNPVLPVDPLTPLPQLGLRGRRFDDDKYCAHVCAADQKKELSALRHLVIQFDSDSVHLFHIPHGALEGPIKLH